LEFLYIALGVTAGLLVLSIVWRNVTCRSLQKFAFRIAELVGLPEDSPLSYVLETAKKKISDLENDLLTAQRSRENILTILDNIVDPIFIVSSDDTIIFANRAAESISRMGIVGRRVYEVLEDYYLNEAYDEALRTWQIQEGNVLFYIDKEKRYFMCRIIPVSLPRGDRRIIILLHDLTEERKLDEMRKEFVSNVSHELRTPLTSIHGYAETLLSDPEMDQQTQRRFLEIIETESARMTRLINDLLDLERLESGEAKFDFEVMNWCDVVYYVKSIIKPLSKKYGVEVHIKCEDAKVHGDKDRLIQMLLNIADNAIKYTSLKDSGEKKVAIISKKVGDKVVVEVADTGPGMSRSALKRIFDRFYRVDKGRSRKMGGSGLGLAIVKTIVDRHNGSINVTSEPGEGTKFTIELPLVRSESENENV